MNPLAGVRLDAEKVAHEIAEKLAIERLLKYHTWAPRPPNHENTPLRDAWMVERNTPTMSRYSLYLELRGWIERHPENPKWIRIRRSPAAPSKGEK